jgi:hypothetical protein
MRPFGWFIASPMAHPQITITQISPSYTAARTQYERRRSNDDLRSSACRTSTQNLG